MRAAIMQPYFLPYIGYFQLIGSVDVFVVYDNIKYTKKGWINRNRMLKNGGDAMFSVPLRKGSDFLGVRERELAIDFDRDKLLDQFKGAYTKAPFFSGTFPLLERIVRCQAQNLFEYVRHSIACVCGHLGLTTELRTSSDIAIRHELKGQEKVLALCQAIGADIYINPIGGTQLYSKDEFVARGIELKFIRSRPIEYPQYDGEFVPWLSIVDVMMFNAPVKMREYLSAAYDLV
jgi:hypothetical protein